MRFTSMFFLLAFIVVSGFSATIADVKADINTIAAQTTTLDNSITAFPLTGGTLIQALAVHNNAVTLGSSINKGTTDVQATTPTPFSDADGAAVLALVEAFEPTIESALTGIVGKKAAFQALPIGGIPALVKQDLSNLGASTTAFENALIAAAPASVVADATALKARVNAAFAAAIAAYA
ncbi:hypothetical protein Hypma_001618 [Hypsizygus marmoreus]|uniref:Hydrophobic surface binding protein n=1 Tax=Hypsizygus marmoreus TaxID=39966 RepID=A0A369JAG8_HYPMA|nr:hypothetical protein Hypma_001618 [Hypsizygus marmoreus]